MSEKIGIDLLTGKPMYEEHPDNDICPKCKKRTWTGDAYHQMGKCRNPECGYTYPGDD